MLHRSRVALEWVAIVVCLAVALVACTFGDVFSRVEATLYDRAMGLWQRPASSEIVIIAIDEYSLEQIGRWPWQRPVHATLLQKLAQSKAKSVTLDIILTESDRIDAKGGERDALLSKAIAGLGRVVLPVTERVGDGVQLGVARPYAPFADAAAALGHTKATIDPDGVVRSAFLQIDSLGVRYDSLALASLRVADASRVPALVSANQMPPSTRSLWEDRIPYVVPYVGPPGAYSQISYVDVLMPEFDLSRLNGKIVLVGMIATGLDEFPTPVSGSSRSMPGVEIHANVIQGLSDGIFLSRAGPMLNAVIGCVVLLVVMIPFLVLTPRRALIWTGCAALLLVFVTALAFRYGGVWFAPFTTLLAILLAYPLWSWRRLEATQRFFDEELIALEREPSMVPQVIGASQHQRWAGDVIDQRIQLLRAGTERLRHLKRFISNTLESLPDAAVVFDVQGNVILANTKAEQVLQRGARSSVIGQSVEELLSDFTRDDGGVWVELVDPAGRGDTELAVIEAKHRSGKEFLVQVGPLSGESQSRSGTIFTLTDITPLRETERKRDEALRFLSHDMRSPQASILTLLEMRRSTPENMPAELMESRIEKYAKRTLNLADEFLRLARAERIKTADFVLLDAGELLRDAVDEAWALGEKKGIRVVFKDKTSGEAWIKAERDLFARTIMNLLSNAIKYSPASTTVSVILNEVQEPTGAMWRIDIADQGYGIAPEDLGKLFSRFTRIQREGQPQEDGIGLGLVFVKTVVARLGGSVSVNSWIEDTPDRERGTTFSILLPRADPPVD